MDDVVVVSKTAKIDDVVYGDDKWIIFLKKGKKKVRFYEVIGFGTKTTFVVRVRCGKVGGKETREYLTLTDALEKIEEKVDAGYKFAEPDFIPAGEFDVALFDEKLVGRVEEAYGLPTIPPMKL